MWAKNPPPEKFLALPLFPPPWRTGNDAISDNGPRKPLSYRWLQEEHIQTFTYAKQADRKHAGMNQAVIKPKVRGVDGLCDLLFASSAPSCPFFFARIKLPRDSFIWCWRLLRWSLSMMIPPRERLPRARKLARRKGLGDCIGRVRRRLSLRVCFFMSHEAKLKFAGRLGGENDD